MQVRSFNRLKGLGASVMWALWLASGSGGFGAEVVLDWDAAQYFQYNIHDARAVLKPSGRYDVVVQFSVSNPQNGNERWDIKTAPEFKNGRLSVAIGWSTEEYQNTGASGEALIPLVFGTGGKGAALPISKEAVTGSTDLGGKLYQVTFVDLPVQAKKTGVAFIDGRPGWQQADNAWARVPVKNAYRYFPITESVAARRQVVDINKCKQCHDGGVHGDVTVPRLSLHGGSRTEELQVCGVCHNPNQTDIPYRTSGMEVSIDFKRMIHSIHAGQFLEGPFMVVGFQGALTDFSGIRFPAHLRDCALCHIDTPEKRTYELPLGKNVLGSTVSSKSIPGSLVDVNPANDLKISPTTAVCSSCHDKGEMIQHMVEKGGRLAVSQADISSGKVKEWCVNCHGPGKEKDVRRVHEVGRSGGVER